ncbi:hypothetical protein Chor_001224, partial [Crotalus horridus]
EALQKKTQETLKLQEEATKFSSESTGRREGRSSPSSAIVTVKILVRMFVLGVHIMTSPKSSSSSNKHSSTVLDNTSFNIPSSYSSPPKTQPSKYELEIGSPRKSSSFSGKEQVENILEEYAQQVRDLQKKLSENTEQHEQQKFALRQSVIELQTNLENAMREKESLNELRATVDDLQTASLLQEEMLKESSSQIEYLKKLVQGHDELEEQIDMMQRESQSKTEILLQQHQDREQAKNQKSLYLRQISQLEGTISQLRSELREGMRMSQDKIEDLEKQLHLVHSEMTEAQIERDQYSQESGNLDDEVQQLLAELHKKDVELNLEKEQNKRLWDRDTGSSITIDNLRRELDNKNMELQRLDSIVRSLQVECEGQIQRQLNSTKDKLHKTVQELSERKLSLDSAERLIADLRSSHLEKERVIERTNDEIQQLRGRVDSKRQEFQQLKSESELLRSVQSDCESLKVQLMEKEKVIEILQKQIESMTEIASLSDMELEKVKLMNVCSERLRVLKEMKLEREELVNEIKATMKVAMGMQKQITAKRGQIDALQSKIKFLEEAMTNATKEKHYLKEERNRLSQELSCMAALNNKLAGELEILKSQDKRLKDKLLTMEAALDKIPSKLKYSKEDPLRDLKQLLQELRSTIDEIPSAILPQTESDSDPDLSSTLVLSFDTGTLPSEIYLRRGPGGKKHLAGMHRTYVLRILKIRNQLSLLHQVVSFFLGIKQGKI